MPSSLILAAIYGAGYATAFSAVGLLAARFAINFAVSMIVARIFSSSAANQNTDNGVRQQVPPATTNSLPIVYGDAYLGGVFVDAVLSIDQKTMYYVLAISQISPNGQFTIDAPGASTSAGSFVTGNSYTIQFIGTTDFTLIGASANTIGVTFTATGPGTGTGIAGPNAQMYWQDQYIAFDATDRTKVISLTDGSGNVQTKVAGNLYINLYTSNEAGTITPLNGSAAPSSVMGGSDIATAQQWPSSGRQMNGLAFAIVKMVYSQDAGTTQMQAITFHAHHYLNSTGVAKPGDVWYDYITNTKYGCGMETSIVDSATATALNSYSDQTITYTPSGGGSATQPRYRINGVLDTGQNVLSNLDQIMLSCDSWNQYNAATGKWSVVINQARSTDFAFDDTNIVGEIRVSAYDISQSINQVEAQFPNKLNRDQAAYVYLNTPSNLLFSNEPLNKYSLTYSLVNESVQAQYLANRLLEQAREDLIVSFATTYNGIQVDAGDVISVTNTAYGWSAKLFRVIKVSEVSLPDGNLGAGLELNEYNVGVYSDASITAFSIAPNSNLPSATYFSPLSAPTVSTSNPLSAIPNFDVTVTLPATGRVTSIDLYYTTAPIPGPTDWKLLSTASSSNGVAMNPGSNYIFSNQILTTGSSSTVTYYFAFTVYNDISKSSLSPTSALFSWTPVVLGAAGTRTAILDMYKWAATAPTTFPSGTSTYTWATGQFTAPATTNGWSITPSAAVSGQTLWVARTIYADNLTTATSTVTWTATTAFAISASGINGTRTAFLEMYQWAASTPSSFPSGTSTYTWATGAFTAPSTPNSWSLLPGATTPGYSLYACSVTFADNLTTSTSTVTWATSTAYIIGLAGTNGTNGANGTNGTNGTNGLLGLSFINAYLVQNQSSSTPTFTTPTSGLSVPSGWSSYAPSVAVGQVMWYIQGQYNPNSVTVNGVGSNTTAWSGPIAASIFQDIRSDNWNGSTPPVASTPTTWGTNGYYISRTDGNMYANGFYARGVVQINGSVYNPGLGYTTAVDANSTSGSTIGVTGFSNSSGGFGVLGWTSSATSYAGVQGSAIVSGAYGVVANNNGGGFGFYLQGKMVMTNSTLVTNFNADYVNGLHFSGVATPNTGTAIFATTTKPSNTTTNNNWLQVIHNGIVYYIPAWQ